MSVRAREAHMENKDDGMREIAGQSGSDPAVAFFKMTILAVMAEVWHKRRERCYPLMDCFPLMQLFFMVFEQFGGLDRFFQKNGQIGMSLTRGLGKFTLRVGWWS